MLGLKRGVLRLVAYSPAWPALYADTAKQLQTLVGAHILDMQHVGSTAIPGMLAKPIIDIAIRMPALQSIKIAIDVLEPEGYTYRGEQGIPGRHLFAKGDPITHHVHCMLPGCSNWEKQTLFKAYLLRFPEKAEAYATLKRHLLATVAGDRSAYSNGKKAFIHQTLEEARMYIAQEDTN